MGRGAVSRQSSRWVSGSVGPTSQTCSKPCAAAHSPRLCRKASTTTLSTYPGAWMASTAKTSSAFCAGGMSRLLWLIAARIASTRSSTLSSVAAVPERPSRPHAVRSTLVTWTLSVAPLASTDSASISSGCPVGSVNLCQVAPSRLSADRRLLQTCSTSSSPCGGVPLNACCEPWGPARAVARRFAPPTAISVVPSAKFDSVTTRGVGTTTRSSMARGLAVASFDGSVSSFGTTAEATPCRHHAGPGRATPEPLGLGVGRFHVPPRGSDEGQLVT
jgi:hypothetical protein